MGLVYYRLKFQTLSAISTKAAAKEAIELFSTPQFRKKLKLSKILEESEKLEINMNGESITGYRWNYGGRRKLLIVHGFNSSVIKFDRYINPLIKKGYEVLAFDAKGHGYSSGKTLNAVEFKDMIIEINKLYGPIKSFIGHSFGGLALSLALEEIPHDENYRLGLIAPSTESKSAIDYFFKFMMLNDKVRIEFDDLIFRLSQKPPEWYSVSRAIENIKAKVFWCHDEDDFICPWDDAKNVMDKNYKHVDFFVTKGFGHHRIYKEPKVANAIIDFL